MFAPKQAAAPKKEESLEEESTNGSRVEANVSDAVNDEEERIDECYLEDYDPATGQCKTKEEKIAEKDKS